MVQKRVLQALNLPHVLIDTCLKLDETLSRSDYIDSKLSGSTGVISLVFEDTVFTANVGDSGALLIEKSNEYPG